MLQKVLKNLLEQRKCCKRKAVDLPTSSPVGSLRFRLEDSAGNVLRSVANELKASCGFLGGQVLGGRTIDKKQILILRS